MNHGSRVRLRPERCDHLYRHDFVHARTRYGRSFQMLTLIEDHTRECPPIDVASNARSREIQAGLGSG